MNTKRLFQGIACAVLAFAVTAPVLARDDRGHDRGRSHHYDRRDDRRDWRDDRGMTGTTAATSARPIATAITTGAGMIAATTAAMTTAGTTPRRVWSTVRLPITTAGPLASATATTTAVRCTW